MNQPARSLGLFDATCVVIGAVIGVGIFFTPSKMAALVPSSSLLLLAWAIGGAIALCGALVFAELGRRSSGDGAQYQVLRDAFGPFAGFLFVFCNATAVQAGTIGIIAVICARNLAAAASSTPVSLSPTTEIMLAVGLIGLVTIANIAGVRWGSRVQNLTVIAKVAALLTIAALAAFATRLEGTIRNDAAPTKALLPVAGVLAALIPAFFSYGGWQHALWISGEVKEPRKNLPLAILVGMGIVVVVYLVANAAYLSLLGHGGVASSKTLAADAVATIYPSTGRRLVAAAVAVSAFGVLNAQLLSGPRLIAEMAADGRFFTIFRRSATGSTTSAILLLTGMALVLLLSFGFAGVDTLLTGVVAIDMIFFSLTALAIFRLPKTQPSLPMASVAAVVFVQAVLGVLVGSALDPETRSVAFIGAAWIAVASLLYVGVFNRRGSTPAAPQA